jgi:predicted enzyme related to lactoylglutathione lyase
MASADVDEKSKEPVIGVTSAVEPSASRAAATGPRAYGAGVSCWTELRATDVGSAVSFYTELFGWTLREVDVASDQSYAVLHAGGDVAAGVSARAADEEGEGASHWRLYTAISAPPATMDLSTRNPAPAPPARVVAKPLGALFAAARAERVPDASAPAVMWMDLHPSALAESAAFCRAFLDDPGAPLEDDGAPVVFANDAAGSAATLLPGDGSALPPWSVGFVVRDCEQTVRRALALGARVAAPVETLEGLGRAAALVDPQGATFVCWQPQDRAATGRRARSLTPAPVSPAELAAAGRATVLASHLRGVRGGDA